jgi:uncharacterized protein with beta-barrel porin domain
VGGLLSVGAASSYNLSAGNLSVTDLDNRGSFVVNGALTGSGTLLNNTTGTLSGSGTIQGNLTNLGTVSPGNSPGTLTINGNYTQTASGTLVEQIASASSYSKLVVTGNAGLDGALKIVLLNGYIPSYGQSFPGIITTAGRVSGTFSTLINQYITPTLYWQVLYSGTSVDLQTIQGQGQAVVARDYTNPGLGLTPNQWQVGNMLNGVANNATGDLNNVLNNIDFLTSPDAVKDAYKQISPEKAGALPVLGFADFYSRFRGLAQRLTNMRFGGGPEDSGFGGGGGFNFNYSRASGLMLAYNSSSLAGLITGKQEGAPAERYGLYLEPDVVLGNRGTTVNNTGYNFTSAGFTLGADYRVWDDLLVGVATGYSHTGASFSGSGGGAENNSWPILAYAAYMPKNFYTFGSLGYTLNLFDLNRQIAFDVINRTARSSTSGNQLNFYGESGYDLKLRSAVVTPMVSLAYSQIWVNGFTEDGAGALNLKVGPQNPSSLQTGVGAKMTVPLKVKSIAVVPQVYASYQHEFSDNARGLDARLSQGSSNFNWTVDRAGRNFAVGGGNLSVGLKKNLNLRLDYNAEVGRKDYTAHNINVGLRWQF